MNRKPPDPEVDIIGCVRPGNTLLRHQNSICRQVENGELPGIYGAMLLTQMDPRNLEVVVSWPVVLTLSAKSTIFSSADSFQGDVDIVLGHEGFGRR